MRTAISYFGCVFFPLSGVVIFLVNGGVLSSSYFYGIVGFGLIFYTLKLYYVNNTSLGELNWVTLSFNALLYAYFVLINGVIWVGIHDLFMHFAADYFTKTLFPTPEVFAVVMRRMVLVGAMFGFLIAISFGINHGYDFLRFTNKVRLLEVLLVLIFTGWLLIDFSFIGVFVSVITFFTSPDGVKRIASRVVYIGNRQIVDFINVEIENNYKGVVPTYRGFEHLLFLFVVLIMPIIHSLIIQVPLSMCLFLFGAIFLV